MQVWRRGEFERKITSLDEALESIPRGAVVYVSPGATQPVPLMDHILDSAISGGWRLIIPWVLNSFQEERYKTLRDMGRPVTTLSLMGEQIEAFREGFLDYIPLAALDLRKFPTLLRPEAAIVTVSHPDRFGYMSLGPSVDLSKCMIGHADRVIGIINSQVPRTFGESLVPFSMFRALVRYDFPLPELAFDARPRPEDEAISHLVYQLIPHGAVLDVRTGRIPAGMLRSWISGKRISLRTEYVTDWILDLFASEDSLDFEEGAPVVTSFAMGTSRLYEFLHDNPMINFVGLASIWNVRASSRPFLSVLGAHRLDLYGRILEREPGVLPMMERLENLVFARRGPNSMSVVLVRSRDLAGHTSFVIPGRGTPVIPAQYVDAVVSEHGIAWLWGRSLQDRIAALIEIAHPDDRSMLLARAKAAGLMPLTGRAAMKPPVMPQRRVVLDDGTELIMRVATHKDRSLLLDLYYSMTEQDLRYRFFDGRGTPDAWCGTLDGGEDTGSVVLAHETGGIRILGQAEFSLENQGVASVAIAVRPQWKRKGLARHLLAYLEEVARRKGVKKLTAEILNFNKPTIALFRSLGWNETSHDYDTVIFSRAIQEPDE